MKRRILFGKWLAVFAVCVMGGEVFAQTTGNLLTNGDANNGLAGWVDPADAWSVVTSESGMSPIDGPWFWPKRRSSASSYVLYQDVSIRAYVGRTVTLSAYAHGWNGQSDKSQLRLEFLNSSGSVLDAAESGVVQGHGWRQLSVSRAVPSGAVTARVKLIGRDYNSMCDSHFDKISLVAGGTAAVSSPASNGNLITNGDANDGLYGWVDPADAWNAVTSESGMNALDGPWFWPARKSSASSYVLYQDVPISAYIGRTATLSAYAHGWNGQSDTSQLRLEFLNSSGSVLDAADSGTVQGHGWRQLSVSRVVPSGAVTARVKLIGKDFRSACDSHFDKISLVTSGTVTGGSSTTRPSGTTSTGTAAFGIGFYLDAGEKIQLSAPSGATWSSSNSSVAKVNSRGIVTAVSEGTAVITATSGGNRSSITVQVSD